MGEGDLHVKVGWLGDDRKIYVLRPSVCSVAAGNGGVIGPHYASSKSALHGLVHWMSLRYSKSGIVRRSHLVQIEYLRPHGRHSCTARRRMPSHLHLSKVDVTHQLRQRPHQHSPPRMQKPT